MTKRIRPKPTADLPPVWATYPDGRLKCVVEGGGQPLSNAERWYQEQERRYKERYRHVGKNGIDYRWQAREFGGTQ